MLHLKKENKKAPSYGFEGLGEKELKALYTLASTKTVQKDEALFREGDVDQILYVILEGEIRITIDLQDHTETISILRDGAWVGEFGFAGRIPRTASALANKPSRLLVIDKPTLNALDEKTQLIIFKRLSFVASIHIGDLDTREKQLAIKNKQLMKTLLSAQTSGKPDYSRSEMIHGIINKVPQLPIFASTLTHKLLAEGTSLKELSQLIKADPSLVGLVLKTLNSSYYGFYRKVSDINRAVVLLGLNGLYQLVVGAGVRRTMSDTPFFNALHHHSVAISHIAFALSQNTQLDNPAQVATIGLLHDLGHVVIELLKEQNPGLDVLIESLDQAQIGALLLKKWDLPDAVWRSVEFQCYPEFSLPTNVPIDVRLIVAIIHLSHLCYKFLEGSSESDLRPVFLDQYLSLLNWGQLSVADITRKFVVPDLDKRRLSFPMFLRELLDKHLLKRTPEEASGRKQR